MNKDKSALKSLPPLQSDADAERFSDEEDLSEYDLSDFRPVQFEFQKKSARLELRLPEDQLATLKEVAKEQGIPHTRLVRQFIEQGIRALRQAG